MNRSTYLQDSHVRAFIEWAKPLITGERKVIHEWHSRTLGSFSCETIYGAYEKYDWPSSVNLEACRKQIRDCTMQIRPTAEHNSRFLSAAIKVMNWGSITRYERLEGLGDNVLQTLMDSAQLLDPECADTDNLRGFKYMGAGFSKIYALMLDDFPMYDSRVACALTSLVWLFCREEWRDRVSEQLLFGVPTEYKAKVDRNPVRLLSGSHFRFPNIRPSQFRKYADSNLKAAWLLGELSSRGQFADVPAGRRVMALQSALFMIGYQPLTESSIREA